jgi:hypothetical protein
MKVMAINRTYKEIPDLTTQVEIYNMESQSIYHDEKNISLSASEVEETSDLASQLSNAKGVSFVVLRLKNSAGKTLSYNTYWLSGNNDFTSMSKMDRTTLDTRVTPATPGKTDKSWTVQITNNTGKLAFFIRPQLMADGEEVLPSFWSAGYFTMAPSETRTVTVSCPVVEIEGKKTEVRIAGWNVEEKMISIK